MKKRIDTLAYEHGTRRLYRKGCTCTACRAANAAHVRSLRARNGLKRTTAQREAEKRYDLTARGRARRVRQDRKRSMKLKGVTFRVIGGRVNSIWEK